MQPTNAPRPSLAQELEACEMAAWTDFYEAAPAALCDVLGIRVERIGSAVAIVAAGTTVLALNRVVGLGVFEPASERTVQDIVGLFGASGASRFFVQLCPGAGPPELEGWLERHGLRPYNNWARLHGAAAEVPEFDAALRVQEIDRRFADVFADIVADAFGWPEAIRPWVADTVGRPGWRHYMAFDRREPVGTGAFFRRGYDAWLGFASTRPEHRGRGAQKALVARRARDARRMGCRRLVVETAEDRPQRPAPSYRNLKRMGFHHTYLRPNYILDLSGEQGTRNPS